MAELKPHQAKQKPVSYLTKNSNKKLFNLNKNIPKNRLIILCGEKTKKQTNQQTKQTKPNQTNSVKLRQGWSSKDLALQFGAWTQLGSRLQVLIFPMRVLGGNETMKLLLDGLWNCEDTTGGTMIFVNGYPPED